MNIVLGYTVSSHWITKSFLFPGPGPCFIKVNGFLLCRKPVCGSCALSPECAAIHHQCFISFVLECRSRLPLSQALDALRTIVFYRRPWPKAAWIKLQPGIQYTEATRYWVHHTGIEDTSVLFRLRYLPPELLDAIRRLSPYAWLWRLTSIFALSHRVPIPTPPQQISLELIGSWIRGENIAIISNSKQPVLRVTIDTEGIQMLSRIPQRPDVYPSVSHYNVYLIEEISSLPGVQVQIKVYPPPLYITITRI